MTRRVVQRWDAARGASRPTRKYKPVAPVGDDNNNLVTGTILGVPFKVRSETHSCDNCRMVVCGCYRLIEWSDGSRHSCSCSGAREGGSVYCIEKQCKAHEHIQYPERFGRCELHSVMKSADGTCHWCKSDEESAQLVNAFNAVGEQPIPQDLKFVGGGEKLPPLRGAQLDGYVISEAELATWKGFVPDEKFNERFPLPPSLAYINESLDDVLAKAVENMKNFGLGHHACALKLKAQQEQDRKDAINLLIYGTSVPVEPSELFAEHPRMHTMAGRMQLFEELTKKHASEREQLFVNQTTYAELLHEQSENLVQINAPMPLGNIQIKTSHLVPRGDVWFIKPEK